MQIRLLDCAAAQQIYETRMVQDFPAAELKPFTAVREMMQAGIYEPLALYDEADHLQAYAWQVLLPGRRSALLDYFAVRKDLRGGGIGTQALQALSRHYFARVGDIVALGNSPYGGAVFYCDSAESFAGFYYVYDLSIGRIFSGFRRAYDTCGLIGNVQFLSDFYVVAFQGIYRHQILDRCAVFFCYFAKRISALYDIDGSICGRSCGSGGLYAFFFILLRGNLDRCRNHKLLSYFQRGRIAEAVCARKFRNCYFMFFCNPSKRVAFFNFVNDFFLLGCGVHLRNRFWNVCRLYDSLGFFFVGNVDCRTRWIRSATIHARLPHHSAHSPTR